jgi:hypothetical protein
MLDSRSLYLVTAVYYVTLNYVIISATLKCIFAFLPDKYLYLITSV